MKPLDRLLQRWRLARARPFIPNGARLLDLGCHQGETLLALEPRLREGVGIDPLADPSVAVSPRIRLIRGTFPEDMPAGTPFDVVTCLAVLEHVPATALRGFVAACHACLEPGGTWIVTVPAHAVDGILRWLVRLRLVEGMSLDQHHGFEPGETGALARQAGFDLRIHRRFQLGLNHLWVFQKPPKIPRHATE